MVLRKNQCGCSVLPGLVIIGASTGGPAALSQLLENLSSDFPLPVVIIQHMLPGFTGSLARRLNSEGKIPVKEAHAGMKLHPRNAIVAPGGQHLFFDRSSRIRLGFQEPRHGVRPSVDVALESAVELFNDRLVAVILTGMGKDGMEGTLLVKEHGGAVVAQDEQSCAVFGMPSAVIKSGASDVVLPIKSIAGHLSGLARRLCNRSTA